MSESRIFLFVISLFFIINSCFSQQNENTGSRILFHGIIMDANTLSPVSNSQILINHEFSSVSSTDGTFYFYVNRNDTVLFKHLGYKSATLFVSDTLSGREFVTGIYMSADTVSIGEVVIVPRFNNLKSAIMNSPSRIPSTMENARYNVAVSAYQGRTTTGKLGDAETNYGYIRQKQKSDAYERGSIPSDKFLTLSPLLLIPGAYLLIHGLPEKPAPMEQRLTDQELDQIYQKYLEILKQKK